MDCELYHSKYICRPKRGLKGLCLLYRKVKRQIKCLMIERWLVYYAIVVGNKSLQISRHHLKIDVSNPI